MTRLRVQSVTDLLVQEWLPVPVSLVLSQLVLKHTLQLGSLQVPALTYRLLQWVDVT